VVTDPNEGLTLGFLPVVLLRDRQGRLEHMIADDLRYNRTTGWFPGFRLLGYPTSHSDYYLVLRKSQKIDEEYEGFYENEGIAGGPFSLLADVGYLRDSLQRFYGIGNGSAERDETNYTLSRFASRLRLAYRPGPSWEIAWQARLEDSAVSPGGVHGLPFAADVFPGTRGLEGSTVHGESLTFAYDDRDSTTQPKRGMLVSVGGELVSRALGSSSSYARYGLEARRFVPCGGRFVLALHGELDEMRDASAAPFYERSQIGGEQSVRGFGDGRFVDAGRVLASAADFPFEHLHVAGGLGLRAVIAPQVVAYVDVGYGSEGMAAFTGLDYPF
jgi:surface antigen Omp85-like protein